MHHFNHTNRLVFAAVMVILFLASLGILAQSYFPLGAIGQTGLPSIVAETEETAICGPDFSTQLVASSTNRSYLYVAIDEQDADQPPVYISLDGDKPASAGVGFRLATSTEAQKEWSGTNNLFYGGGVRCTASASTTVQVIEYLAR